MKHILERIMVRAWIFILIPCLFAISFLVACEQKELDIQQNFPFDVIVMPIPKEIAKGETVEIRVRINSEGNYSGNKYFLRYFQFDGKGVLGYQNSKPFRPNDLYAISELEFRLYYRSESTVSQSFDIWFSDSFGNEKQVSFQFNPATEYKVE